MQPLEEHKVVFYYQYSRKDRDLKNQSGNYPLVLLRQPLPLIL